MNSAPVENMPVVPLALMGVAVICFLVIFVVWIMTLVKQFKAGDTVWGILTILLQIPGLIWLFMNGPKKLAVIWLLMLLIGIGCYVGGFAGIFAALPDAAPAVTP